MLFKLMLAAIGAAMLVWGPIDQQIFGAIILIVTGWRLLVKSFWVVVTVGAVMVIAAVCQKLGVSPW